jgi:hypothetical protein
MADKLRDHYFTAKDIAFHLTSSDRELLDKVSKIMKRNGHISFSDSMGKEHYILDGRRGVGSLTQNIDDLTCQIASKNKERYDQMKPYHQAAIDSVMDMSQIPSSLKGFRYIKHVLHRVIEDDSLISPLSKTVYPDLCEIYHCTPFQIERDIRYAIRKSKLSHTKLSPKAFICTLLEFANRLAHDMATRDATLYASFSGNETEETLKSSDESNEVAVGTAPNLGKIPFIHPYPCEIDYQRFDRLLERN